MGHSRHLYQKTKTGRVFRNMCRQIMGKKAYQHSPLLLDVTDYMSGISLPKNSM